MDNNWIVATILWHEYPIGTKAKAVMGGYWVKTERGWHWPGGGTFPTPGGDATGEVCLPESPKTQLPAEVEAEIEAYADEITKPLKMDNDYQVGYNNGMEAGAISAGTHFAEKLHQAQLEIEQLKRWKGEASILLNPILDYGQSKEAGIPYGKSITNTVLERCKQYQQAKQMLFRLASLVNADQNPDKKFLTEIKEFLDGE